MFLGQGCGWMGTVVHELGHAIGFFHEQKRSDRDDWIDIYWESVKEGKDDSYHLMVCVEVHTDSVIFRMFFHDPCFYHLTAVNTSQHPQPTGCHTVFKAKHT